MQARAIRPQWSRIEKRIASEFGPLNVFAHIGHDEQTTALRKADEKSDPDSYAHEWVVQFDLRFHDGDNLVGHHLLRGTAPTSWFAVNFSPAGLPASRDSDLICSTSFKEAVAYLYGCCRASAFFPDRLIADTGSERLQLLLNGESFATVQRVHLQRPVANESQLRRAKSTLIGYRQADDWQRELAHRISNWPGLRALRPGPGKPDSHISINSCIAHLPVPSEWLFNARCLLQAAGLDASTDAQQRLVAAYFGAPTFNHLLRGKADACTSLAGPWAIEEFKDDRLLTRTVFQDPFEAFVALTSNLRGAIAGWKCPSITVRHDSETHFELIASDGKHHEPDAHCLSLKTVSHAVLYDDEQHYLDAVNAAFVGGDPMLLADLFRADTTPAERHALSLADGRILVRHDHDGLTYVFHLSADSKYLFCSRFNRQGNAVTSPAGSPLYKGSLRYQNDVQAWVIFSNYNSTHPCDAFPSLSREAVDVISALFEENRSQPSHHTEGMEPDDKRRAIHYLRADREAREAARRQQR